MTRDDVLGKVTEILVNDFAVPVDKVRPDASFRGALGLDSLDAVDLVFFVEQGFGIKAGLHAYRELHTVDKLVDFILAYPRNG